MGDVLTVRNDDQGARQAPLVSLVENTRGGRSARGRARSGYRDSPPVTVTPSNRSRYFAHVPRTCDSPSRIGEGEKNEKKKAKKKM